MCLFKNTDDWYNGSDLGKLVGLVSVDLRKAFDTVHPKVLCKRLSSREFKTVRELSLGLKPISPKAYNFVGQSAQLTRQNCLLLVR